jgi:hypothetical protein
MYLKGVTNIVESNTVAELGVRETDHMTPGAKGAGVILHARVPRYFADKVGGNKVANLAQNVEVGSCWFDFDFHPRLVAGLQTLSQHIFSNFLWDGCGNYIRAACGINH